MGNPEIGPLAEAVDAMLVALGLMDVEHQGEDAVGGTHGALIVRAAAVMVAEASAAVDDSEQRAYAEDVIEKAFTLAEGRDGRGYFLPRPILADVKRRLQAAVDALVGVHPYA